MKRLRCVGGFIVILALHAALAACRTAASEAPAADAAEDDLASVPTHALDPSGNLDIYKLQDFTWDRAGWFYTPTIAISPDGRYMALAGGVADTGRLHVWDLRLGQELFLVAHDLPEVMIAAFSPDSTTLVTGHMGGSLRKWRVADSTVSVTRGFDQDWIRAVTFSPDGREIAVGGQDGALYFLGAADLVERWSTKAHLFGLSQAAFSSDGSTIFTVGDDQHINVWNSKDGTAATPRSELRRGSEKAHMGMIKSLALFDDDRHAVSGAYWEGGNIKSYKSIAPPDHVLRLWDLQTGQAGPSFPFEWGVRCCIQTVAKRIIAFVNVDSQELDSTVRLFNLETHKQVQIFHDDSPVTDTYRHGVQAFALIPRSRLMVIGLRSGRYVLWDYVANRVVAAFIATDSSWAVIDAEHRYDGSPDASLTLTSGTAGVTLPAGNYMRLPGLLAKTIAAAPQ